jgi:acetate CoA/acetoacetate CoA-transferase beta subunit
MEHTTKGGEPRILKKCRLPLTAAGEVNLIVTEMAVIEVTGEGLLLKEISQGWSVKDVQDATEAELKVSPSLIVTSHESRLAA